MRVILGAVALVAACSASETRVDPGRVTLHRLNNAEYNNTVRDLLGTSLQPANEFPTDDRAYGFDTIGDVLRVSTLGMELYETAAANVINDVLTTNIAAESRQYEIVGTSANGQMQAGGWLFYSTGSTSITHQAPGPGRYHLKLRAYQTPAGPDPARISVEIPGEPPTFIDVTALGASPAIYEIDLMFAGGTQVINVGFVNDYYDQTTMADRNVWIDYLVVEGPYDGPSVDEGRRGKIFTCPVLAANECQDEILTKFTSRAWRRPATADEIARLRAIVSDSLMRGGTPEEGLRIALQAVLVSPHFLYRVEIDPSPTDKTGHPLSGWELASRLSYFLWSSMPDAELFAAAEDGSLLQADVLESQVRRMLDDPKAVALTDNFAGQWLFTRALGSQDPDYTLFPDYDDELEEAMRAETRRYFQAFLQDDLSMTEFLTADFTYLNDRLAAFYGLPLPGSTDLVRVSLADSARRGFLMQGSFLRVTSRPKRTSPVLRGKWVLDNLLCAPPPPPPPGVEGFPEEVMATGSIRDRLEAHQTNPVCASCHRVMDPIGYALDNFDAIGKYRTEDKGFPIDSTGMLFGDIPFANAIDLTEALAEQPNVYRCIVEKLYAYSGRPPIRVDAIEHIEELTASFAASDYSLRELLVAVATHHSFTSRRGEP